MSGSASAPSEPVKHGELVVPGKAAPAAPRKGRRHGDVSAIDRLAKDPAVDVAKLEKLLELRERIISGEAKAEFEAAFAEMQGELPVITEHGAIEVDGVVRSKYARYEDIIEVIRPILKRYGFALRHRNETLPDGKLRITGILSHRAGHAEEDQFDCPADTSGKKNNIQAMGSTRSYGQRYTTISLLNIVTRGADDDGKGSESPDAPKGYDSWKTDMEAAADEGLRALTSAWNASPKEFRDYAARHDRESWERLKQKASRVQVAS